MFIDENSGTSTDVWQQAIRLQQHAVKNGFAWDNAASILDKLAEEIREVQAELAAVAAAAQQGDSAAQATAQQRLQEEIGDMLFMAVYLARHGNVDVTDALACANAKFIQRFNAMCALAAAQNQVFSALGLADKQKLWQQVKQKHAD